MGKVPLKPEEQLEDRTLRHKPETVPDTGYAEMALALERRLCELQSPRDSTHEFLLVDGTARNLALAVFSSIEERHPA